MEIDISFSFTKILCMKCIVIFFLGGGGRKDIPAPYLIISFLRGWAVHLVSLRP